MRMLHRLGEAFMHSSLVEGYQTRDSRHIFLIYSRVCNTGKVEFGIPLVVPVYSMHVDTVNWLMCLSTSS